MAKTSRQIRPHRNHFPTRARSASSCRMTHAPPEARPPRPRGEYRWPPRKAHAFLEALALHGKVAAAARAVGMTRQSAYKLKQRVPVVAEGWTRAQAIGRARRRGKPVLSGDEGATVSVRHGQCEHWDHSRRDAAASPAQCDTSGMAR